MKKLLGLAIVLVAAGSVAFGQFKANIEPKPTVSESLVRPDDGLIFGWFDPSRLTMRHSYSLSYSSFGGRGLSLGVYTNSLYYQISAPLDVQFDISVMHSPFNSFGKEYQNQLSGIYLSRAQLNYRPAENMLFQIQFRQVPAMYWMGNYGYGSWNSGFGRMRDDDR
ncbi:MAG TPA: hypothetical protein VNN76_10655 [Bacteroidota bacterium]|nr:hypothetical protein [Bacteroidota bacterium]